MSWLGQAFSYLPLLLALYSAWTSGGFTPLLQFALTVFIGRLLNTALNAQLKLMFAGATRPFVVLQMSVVPAAVATLGFFCGCSMRMLGSYAFTSFVFPALRRLYPRAGNPVIAAVIVAAIAYAWQEHGISPFLVFIVFLQALPEIQRPLWIGGRSRSRLHAVLVACVCAVAAPFALLGGVTLARPELLGRLSDAQLRGLCYASNGCPSIDHRDLYAALGLGKYASPAEVRKAYRRISLENHPDKLSSAQLEPEERLARVELFTRAAGAYEVLSKPGAQGQYDAMLHGDKGIRPELLDLAPRCVAVALLLVYWLAVSAVHLREARAQKHTVAERLRRHILQRGPINLPAIGLASREPLEEFARFHELPIVMRNDEHELDELRRMLAAAGVGLLPSDPAAERTVIRSTRGDPEGLRAHVLNGGAMCCGALGVSRERLEAYACDTRNAMVSVAKNGNDDVRKMRELLEQSGVELEPMPEGEHQLIEIKG